MKLNDIIVMVMGLLLAIGMLVFIQIRQEKGAQVCIKLDGEVYIVEDISKDQQVEIKDKNDNLINVFIIEGGTVYMSKATCPDALCIKQGEIQATHETIVCLPNRVTAGIINEDIGTIDAVAQ